jgi:ADP-ribose pyrophosphatase
MMAIMSPPDRTPLPWQRVSTRHADDMLLFRPRWDAMRNPRTGTVLDRLVLETPDWVNVVAVTGGGELVCVRQFRFGTAAVELEIPAGIVDPGEGHEEAARRELREETGYTATRWAYLGSVASNPAFQDNLCHHWLADDAEPTDAQALDPGEDIAVELVPIADAPALVAGGILRHSLVVSALARVVDLRIAASSSPASA